MVRHREKRAPLSAVAVRDEIVRMTALPLRGVVQELPSHSVPSGARAAYAIGYLDDVVFCVQFRNGWDVRLTSGQDTVRVWSTVPPEPGLLDFMRGAFELSAPPIFEKSLHETSTDISRKDFRSDIGHIRLHTRRRGDETELVFELVDRGRVVRFFQDRRTGRVDFTRRDALPAVPF